MTTDAVGQELSQAFRDLLDEVAAIEGKILGADPALDEPDVIDGYRLAFSLLRVAVDAYVWGDKDNPRFVDVIGPYQRWGGDNSDAFYQLAPIDPNRSYRVTGNRGDSVYLSITVYGGPDDGHYSNRIVGTMNDRSLEFDDDGNFEFMISPEPQPGAWLKLESDAVVALTRDYLKNPETDRRVQWTIEAIDPPARLVESRTDLIRRLRSAKTLSPIRFRLSRPRSSLPTRSPNHIRCRSRPSGGRPATQRTRWEPTSSAPPRP